MSHATAVAAALKAQQLGLEEVLPQFGAPSSFTLSMAGQTTTGSMAAAIHLGNLMWRQNEQGQSYRVSPLVITVRKELLPSWATVAALPGAAKVTADGLVYKVSAAQDQGQTLLIRAIRWPDDPPA